MRNNNNITRLKRISVLIFACGLLTLVAALMNPKKVALDAIPAAVQAMPEKTESIPEVATTTPVAAPTAKPKQNIKTKPAVTALPAPIKQAAVFATQAEAKAYLQAKVSERDFIILENIILCESGWNHYRPDGSVKISPTRDVGFGQINLKSHAAKFKKMGIDIYSDKGNLDATISLYTAQGVGPWKPYSGKCWLPKLKAKGISV